MNISTPLCLIALLACPLSPLNAGEPTPASAHLPAGDPAPAADEAQRALSRPGHGQAVCGLGKAFHAGRRAALRQALGEGIVIVRGMPETRDYTEFRQDKTFWYLTGIESPDATLVMDAASGLELLFLPARDKSKEFWEGELWDPQDAWVKELSGFRNVRANGKYNENLMETLGELLDGRDDVWVSLHPWVGLSGGFDRAQPADDHQLDDPLDGRPSREKQLAFNLEKHFGVTAKDLRPALDVLRLTKQPEEIAAMRRAGIAGARAMAEAMRSTRPGLGEWELDALIGFEQVRQGGDGPAYHAIVGAGPNSTTLHYSASARVMQAGEVLCVDAGPELDHYTTDITRSWPVSGTFSERQADMYDAVLAAQEAGLALSKPGETITSISNAANQVLIDRGYGDMIRHGVCHWIGLEVHDVGNYATPLAPGMAFTVEPGIYDEEHDIGIRIEDVVVITEDGHENLTRGVPVLREEVEALVQAQGMLDRN
ncbi:MAG: Xaa-Pro aminopeptidase [Planctomycetota bacterium]|nr:MAG: Xaa-Pro aminopeptidase [Planctomycetota bacterium]